MAHSLHQPDSFIADLQALDSKKRTLFAIMLAGFLTHEKEGSPSRKNVLNYVLKEEQRKSWRPAGFETEDYLLLIKATVTGNAQSSERWDNDETIQCSNMINLGLSFMDNNRFRLYLLEPDLVGEYFVLEGGGRKQGSAGRI